MISFTGEMFFVITFKRKIFLTLRIKIFNIFAIIVMRHQKFDVKIH